MFIDPKGDFAYVSNNGSDNVSAYAIDASTGVLMPVGARTENRIAPSLRLSLRS
jgi:6-phosphogluconolactonase (cycloisomerase 2 family)